MATPHFSCIIAVMDRVEYPPSGITARTIARWSSMASLKYISAAYSRGGSFPVYRRWELSGSSPFPLTYIDVTGPSTCIIATRAMTGNLVGYSISIDGTEQVVGSIDLGGSIADEMVLLQDTGFVTEPYGRNYETTVIETSGRSAVFAWDTSSDLAAWSKTSAMWPVVESGYLTSSYVIYITTLPTTLAMLGACLARPGIERTVACTDDGQLSERYEAGAFADILSGEALDAHPELCYTGAAGIGHLALVWQRDDDVVCATSSGVPTSGWSDVATVREDRSYPTACVIAPTHDLYVVAIESSAHIAYGQRLRWKGSSYDIGTESIVSSGDVADERGHVLCAPGNVLVYTYADTSGNIQVLRSSDCGATWA